MTTTMHPPAVETAQRHRFLDETWQSDARSDRIFAWVAIATLLLSWLTDIAVLGLSQKSFAFLGLRVVHALTALPMLVSASRAKRWLRHDWARLFFFGAVPALSIVIYTLKPTSIAMQGWSTITAWFVCGIGIRAPLRPKL